MLYKLISIPFETMFWTMMFMGPASAGFLLTTVKMDLWDRLQVPRCNFCACFWFSLICLLALDARLWYIWLPLSLGSAAVARTLIGEV